MTIVQCKDSAILRIHDKDGDVFRTDLFHILIGFILHDPLDFRINGGDQTVAILGRLHLTFHGEILTKVAVDSTVRTVQLIIIAALQTADSLGVPISVDVISKVSGSANEEEIMGILTSALAGRFTEASSKLDKVMIDYGLSGQDIIRQMHSQIFKLSVDTESKVKLIDKTGEIEFRIIEGSNEKIQLEALLAYMVLIGEKN